jgi:hypothetical protein
MNGSSGNYIKWDVRCDCGFEKTVTGHSLRSNHAKTCGRKECPHFQKLKRRGLPFSCEYLNQLFDKRKHRFETLEQLLNTVGPRPGKKFLVPKNKHKPLGPDNFAWEDKIHGWGGSMYLTHKGVTKNASEWAALCGVSRQRFHQRLKYQGLAEILEVYGVA